MRDLLGPLALLGALVLSGEQGPGVLGMGDTALLGGVWTPLMGGDGDRVQAGARVSSGLHFEYCLAESHHCTSPALCPGCASQCRVPTWAMCVPVCPSTVSPHLCVPVRACASLVCAQ